MWRERKEKLLRKQYITYEAHQKSEYSFVSGVSKNGNDGEEKYRTYIGKGVDEFFLFCLFQFVRGSFML